MRERSGFRAGGARPFSNFSQNGSRGIARHDGNGDDAAAGGFHFFATDDLIAGPITAFYEDVREKRGNQFARRRRVEDHHGVDALQRHEDFRALALRDDRTAFAFQLPHAGVAIEPDDERITQFARQLQAADVAGVQQVEAAVGKNDAAAVAFLAAKPQNRFLERQDRWMQRVSMLARTKTRMLPTKKLVYHAREARRLRARGPR
jgi:hypothetical protein